MILKELELPVQALQCRALLARLQPNNDSLKSKIESDLKKWMKGYYGEKECVFYLSLLREDRYYIFHVLRLTDQKPFQMDLLILSQWFSLICEVKNYSGKLKFKKNPTLVIKEYNQQEDGIPNPISQVKRHHMQFLNWLRKHKIPLPIESVAVISKTTTIVEAPDNLPIFNDLIYAEAIPSLIQKLETKYQKPELSKKRLGQLADLLLKQHQPHIPNVLQSYQISPDQIRTGVQCPACNRFSMVYASANWQCPSCLDRSKTAHLPAVNDHFLLISPTITRKQFRHFLKIENDRSAKYVLKNLNLPSIGTKKGTKYYLSNNRILSPPEENDMKKGEILT